MKYIGKKEIVRSMADRAQIPGAIADVAYKTILSTIQNDLSDINKANVNRKRILQNNSNLLKRPHKFPKNKGVNIPKLGAFVLHTYTARKGYNPVTKQSFKIPTHNYPSFKPSSTLSNYILKIYKSKIHLIKILINELNQRIAWEKKLLAGLKHR